MIASTQFTITDLNDPYQQGEEPDDPVDGMLWIDTSGTEPALKRYTWDSTAGTGSWIIVADGADHEKVDDVVNTVASLTIDNTELRGSIETVTSRTEEVDGNLATYEKKVSSYIRFNEDGLELGKSDSDFKTNITNTEMGFYEGENKVAYISNQDMYITQARVTNTLSVGSVDSSSSKWFDFLITSNGLGIKRRVGTSS